MHECFCTYKHAQCGDERDDFKQTPEGEEDVAKHRKILPISMAASAQL